MTSLLALLEQPKFARVRRLTLHHKHKLGTSGAAKLGKAATHLEHIDEVITRLTVPVKMEPGDVVLLDSYQVLHGRATFDGAREHGVLWLASPTLS